MSVDPSFALQKAFLRALDGNTEAGNNVFDRVPNGHAFPRIVIGEGETTNRRIGSRAHACYYAGSETVCFVHVFGGRGPEIGFPETKRIADKVRDILDDADLDLSADGHRLEMLDYETSAYESEADGITRRAIMVFRAWTQALGVQVTAARDLSVRAIASEGGLSQFETWLGTPANRVMVFANADTWANLVIWLQDEMAEQAANTRPLEAAIALTVSGTSLAQVAAGLHDATFNQIADILLARTVVPAGGPIPVRIGWEFNLVGQWPWEANGHEADYVEAFRRVVTLFRAKSSRFVFCWCPNWSARDGGGAPIDPTPAYPGDDYVDIVGMDVYFITAFDQDAGQTPLDVWANKLAAPFGLNWLTGFATAHEKLIAIPEWGINIDGGEDYITAMSDWIEAGNVYYHGYWDRNAGGNHNNKLSTNQYPTTGARFIVEFGNDAA